MFRRLTRVAMLLLCAGLTESITWGQHAGSRANAENESDVVSAKGLRFLKPEEVEAYIAVDGSAEIRVRPTEIRIVFAVTSEGKTAAECQAGCAKVISKLKSSWSEQGIPDESIVEDFIAVLPVYVWAMEDKEGTGFAVEQRDGFRMQSNVHVAVPNDAEAVKAFETAFEQGVTDIIAFDYWSKELDEAKSQAREQAVKAARGKSDQLFSVLFDEAPRVINFQEKTTVYFPASLYGSFVNAHDQELSDPWWRDTPSIHASRPRNTYYRGLQFDGDVQARELPMHPEITVVSTVRLYYESRADKQPNKSDKAEGN